MHVYIKTYQKPTFKLCLNKKIFIMESEKKEKISPEENSTFIKWPGNFSQCAVFLHLLPYCKSTSEIVAFVTNPVQLFIEIDTDLVNLIEQIKTLEFSELGRSCVYSYMVFKFQEKNTPFSCQDWKLIVSPLFQSEISDSLLILFKEIKLKSFLAKTKGEAEFLIGVKLCFSSLLFSRFRDSVFYDSKGLDNVLKFIKVDQSLRQNLIKKTYYENSTDCIFNFLKTYTLSFDFQ